MARRLTTADLIAEVRSISDEANVEDLTDADIISSLNRAQDRAASILSRHYPEPLLTRYSIAPTTDSAFPLPEDILEDKLVKLEVEYSGDYIEVTRISYRDITDFEVPAGMRAVTYPQFYYIKDDEFILLPAGGSFTSLRVWYIRDPLPLVAPQGQIMKISGGANGVWLDNVGADLTPLMDEKNSYVNIIDGETGKRKGSLQILNISDKLVNFRTVPERSNVDGLSISGSLSTVGAAPDDYICTIHGSCIPFRKKPLSNFLINFAVADVMRKMGGAVEVAIQIAKDFEQEVERMWAGQENTLRIKDKKRNSRRSRLIL